jgi:hypothetical protein
MDEALRFFRTYELWIYALLALVSLIYLRRFILAWGELRGAAFGLERESAQTRLNQAAGMLVLLMMIALLSSSRSPSLPRYSLARILWLANRGFAGYHNDYPGYIGDSVRTR